MSRRPFPSPNGKNKPAHGALRPNTRICFSAVPAPSAAAPSAAFPAITPRRRCSKWSTGVSRPEIHPRIGPSLYPPPFPLLSPVESGGAAVDPLMSLSWLRVCRRGIFGGLRGGRREKDPIKDGCRHRRKENDRQQGVLGRERVQANAGVGGTPSWKIASDFQREIGLEFSRHSAAHRIRCEKTAFFQRKLLPRQIPTFSAVRRGEFINN